MKKLLTVLLVFIGYVPLAHAQGGPFQDISPHHEHFEAIMSLYSQGVIEGYEDHTFRPYETISRAEMVKILASAYYSQNEIDECLSGIPETERSEWSYKDVRLQDWYAPYVCSANWGIGKPVDGYPDGTFRPQRRVNFVETAKLLVMFENQLANNGKREELPWSSVSRNNEEPWYAEYVKILGLYTAIPMSITHFDQLVTRGEMAEMVYRMRAPHFYPNTQSYSSLR